MFLQFVLIVFALMSCMIDQSSKLVHGVEWRALRGLMLGLFCPDVLADGCALVSLLCSGAWCLECLALAVGDGVDGLARGGDGKGWSCLPLVVVGLPYSMADIVRICADGLEQSAEMVAECLEPMAWIARQTKADHKPASSRSSFGVSCLNKSQPETATKAKSKNGNLKKWLP